jgi:hypothetical protein
MSNISTVDTSNSTIVANVDTTKSETKLNETTRFTFNNVRLGLGQEQVARLIAEKKNVHIVGGRPSGKSLAVEAGLDRRYVVNHPKQLTETEESKKLKKETELKELKKLRHDIDILMNNGVRTDYPDIEVEINPGQWGLIWDGPKTDDERYYFDAKKRVKWLVEKHESIASHSHLSPIYPVYIANCMVISEDYNKQLRYITGILECSAFEKKKIVPNVNVGILAIIIMENADSLFIPFMNRIDPNLLNQFQLIMVSIYDGNSMLPDLSKYNVQTVHLPKLSGNAESGYALPSDSR